MQKTRMKLSFYQINQVFTAIRSVILSFNMFNGFKYHNFVFKKQPKLQGMEVIFCARA